MAWDVIARDGIWLPQAGWWLDARQPVDRSFVSHAHFDHMAAHREVLCSAGTARLMRSRLAGTRIEHVLAFGEGEQLTDDCTVTLHPAGHIFGSAQALLEHHEHGRLLYTGDFKLRSSRSAERCATPRADVLIMETTYGLPRYAFPPTEQILADIVQFCRDALESGHTPVLFGYSLGKSQELLSGLHDADLPVMLHPATFRLTRIYEEFGLQFPPYREFAAASAPGNVIICPHQPPGSAFLRRLGEVRTAIVTGWAHDPSAIYRYQCDAGFPLSDHADFPDLLRFVELAQPTRVFTVHGFAEEFARTLRERGIEAWALGRDNQLDLPIRTGGQQSGGPAVGRSSGSAVQQSRAADLAPPPDGQTARRPDSFARFASMADAVRATSKKREKVALLAAYFATLSVEDFGRAAVYFTGRPFPQADGRTLNLGWSVLRSAVLNVTGGTEQQLRDAYHQHADVGEATAALFPGSVSQGTTLSEIDAFLSSASAARGVAAKLDLLEARLDALSAAEAKYLVKIVTGDLRIGLKEGLVEEAIAAATGRDLGAVRETGMLSGDLGAVARAARGGTLCEIQLKVFNPIQFMLASPVLTAAEMLERLPGPVWLEEKYDGIRCQLHKSGSRVEIYSRDLHRITPQFPELARAAETLPRDLVADGELLAWRDGRALPFADLQKRLGRKGDDFFLGSEIPVSISFYDLLAIDGRPVLKQPLSERRELLASVLAAVDSPALVLAPVRRASTTVEIERAFMQARKRGNEGLIAKDPASAYTPGRRGLAWLKLKKAYATLDVVVVGVEYGHGKRRAVLSDYTFAIRDTATNQLLTVGKAYSGLTDAEIAEMTQHFMEQTLEERGRYRTVVPDVVLEVAFDRIQPSPRHQSGYALRFPRILRIRTDKTPADIDTLETCRTLASAM